MRGINRWRQAGSIARAAFAIAAGIMVGFAALILWTGRPARQELSAGSAAALGKPSGAAQLVSVVPLPEATAAEGEICRWQPASANSSLVTSLRAAEADEPAGAFNDVDRAPVRIIRDSYSTYSAVGVDLTTNEVYLQDENLFGFMVFDRKTNTPPKANFSEPKRRIRGNQTRLEFNCSLWIDPLSGDVYSVNNDMVDLMVVFPRGAVGDVAPMRQLHTPHRAFGIAVDQAANELYLTIQHPPQVVVYKKTAANEDRPLRILSGEQTKLEDAHGIAIDTKNQWMFVANHGATSSPKGSSGRFDPPSITVYPLKSNGDTAPLRTITGPKTQMNWPALMYLDEERGELYVANDMANSILVFKATDSGDAAPTRVIRGSKTGLKNPTGVFLDAKNNEMWVSNMGNHSATVFARTASGDVAPLRTIRSAPVGKEAQMIGNPGAVGYDTKREEILVPN
jgi:6-phosphogluconolactonase (cycloisomerase 2 family)